MKGERIMNSSRKKVLAFVIVLTLLLSSGITAFAVSYPSDSEVYTVTGQSPNQKVQPMYAWVKNGDSFLAVWLDEKPEDKKAITSIIYDTFNISVDQVTFINDDVLIVKNNTLVPKEPRAGGNANIADWYIINLGAIPLVNSFRLTIDTTAGGFDVTNATFQIPELPTYYTVTYDPGSQETAFIVTSTGGLLSGAATPTAPAMTVPEGWVFDGWSPEWSSTVTADVTYVAQWESGQVPTTYTVTYEPGTQGTFAVTSTGGLALGDPTPTAPAVTGNEGYEFTGWSPTPTETVEGNATYVAQWRQLEEPITYTVTYEPAHDF